jgi:DNA-binding NarL/FixJ family response regulator
MVAAEGPRWLARQYEYEGQLTRTSLAMTQPDRLERPARILVVDDHPIVREGLAALIATQPDMEICGEAEDVADALGCFEKTNPDLVIIDISLKSGNGIHLIKRLQAGGSQARMLVWSMYPDNLYAERALRAGAAGYVHKGKATRQIIDAIHAVLAGEVYLSEEVASSLLAKVTGAGDMLPVSPLARLADRELEAFELLGRGLTTRQIAEKMRIKPKTVETYRQRLKEKLNLSNGTELVQRAAQWRAEQRSSWC